MNNKNSSSKSGGEPSGIGRRRRFWFRLCAVMLALTPFLLLEGALRLFDVARPADSSDPLSGFNRSFALFERQAAVYRTVHGREPFFSPQDFPAAKPTNAFRIFCLGGSTVHGHPYEAATAFPAWLELELAGTAPARTYQAVNCGGVSYASYRLAPIAKEVLGYHPDLIVLATGENEFLEDRTYQALKSRPRVLACLEDAAFSLRILCLVRNWVLLAARPSPTGQGQTGNTPLASEVKPKLDDRSGYASYHRDDQWHDQVTAQFEVSIHAIVKMCRDARVPLLLVKLGSNLRDCPPFKSEHGPGLSAQQERQWQDAFDTATLAERTDGPHQLDDALALYLEAEALDGEYALLAFRIARVLDRLGRKTEALVYYRKARDLDVCPLRMPGRHEQILNRIAAEAKIPLVDAAGLLSDGSPDHIPGNDWYLDHVHPTIGGHQKIARAIAGQLQSSKLVPDSGPWPDEKRRESYARHLGLLGPAYFADGRRRVEWLENWARRQRLFDETLPQDGPGYLRLGFRQFDLGDEDAAWESFGEAIKRDASLREMLRQHARELLAEGRSEAGQRLLARDLMKHQ